MNWQGNGYAPPPPDHTPYLLHLTKAITDLSHSSGRIEARLEHGDTMFREIKEDLGDVKTELAAMKAAKPDAASPSRIEALRKLAEVIMPAAKEAWPFLAVAGAGAAKALGYDLSWMSGP